jgi:flagellar basal body-associated protein FliL
MAIQQQKQKQKSSSSTPIENIILIILASLSLLIALFLIFYMIFKYSCKNTFIQKFPNYGACIYTALNKNLSSSQMNQVCNAILNCPPGNIQCLIDYLTGMLQDGQQTTLTAILTSFAQDCNIPKQ